MLWKLLIVFLGLYFVFLVRSFTIRPDFHFSMGEMFGINLQENYFIVELSDHGDYDDDYSSIVCNGRR